MYTYIYILNMYKRSLHMFLAGKMPFKMTRREKKYFFLWSLFARGLVVARKLKKKVIASVSCWCLKTNTTKSRV